MARKIYCDNCGIEINFAFNVNTIDSPDDGTIEIMIRRDAYNPFSPDLCKICSNRLVKCLTDSKCQF